jgi:hypothetical protein
MKACLDPRRLAAALVALDDHTRLPWRFLARRIAIDGPLPRV